MNNFKLIAGALAVLLLGLYSLRFFQSVSIDIARFEMDQGNAVAVAHYKNRTKHLIRFSELWNAFHKTDDVKSSVM